MSYRLERFHEALERYQDRHYASPRVERTHWGAVVARTLITLGVLYILAHWIIKWVG